jgi:hypothetical protein
MNLLLYHYNLPQRYEHFSVLPNFRAANAEKKFIFSLLVDSAVKLLSLGNTKKKVFSFGISLTYS